MQKAVGNDAKYSTAAYKNMCKVLNIPWRTAAVQPTPASLLSVDTGNADVSVSGLVDSARFAKRHGIAVEGLMAMYTHMGLDCLKRDMRTLGIAPENTDAQLESLRRTVKHLKVLEGKVKASNELHRQLRDQALASKVWAETALLMIMACMR